ncbi:ABC transporter [Macleaya cordata]|uniref:ABC transporter n=1 Tax=Macleaya cordata TaxID=56857 RepID=A0A200RA43_MACCD|nr:ABC transporter [Macleaya cordata]
MEQIELSTVQANNENPPTQKRDSPSSSSSNWKPGSVSFFGLFAYADKTDCFLMFFGSVGACIHGGALPMFFLFFGHLIDSLGSLSLDRQSLSSQVSKNSLYLVYLGLLVLASAWMGVACWMQTGERQTARLRVKYLQTILKQDIDFFDTKASDEDIIFRISSDSILVQDAIGDKIGHCLRYLSQFVSGFALGFVSVWQLTLLTIAVVPFIAIAGGMYTIIMSSLSKKSEAAYAEASKVAEEVISQIRTVYSYAGEDKAVEAYSRSLRNALKLEKKSGFAKGVGIGFTYGLLFCAWALLLWYSGILVRHRVTTGAKAFTTIINTIFSGFALGQAAPNLAAFAKGRAAASNIISMIGKDAYSSIGSDNGITLPKVAGQIEFNEVSFAYPSRSNMVFESLSFSVSAGKTFAVVGHSGSGKSTVISMVERFYDPTSGKILLDGHDLKSLQLKWLRKQMGLVSQEPALFATTIAENILYGKEDANMEQILEAARASNAHSFIQSLPNGYNTQVGEGGTQLSGGQKQRIAIARALLRNPKILLLDEATSALDAESELLVQQELNTIVSNRTTIIVAHRLSTIRNVDKILVLKNGQVVESGTHLELMSRGEDGDYFTLVRLQVSSNIEYSSQERFSGYSGSSVFSEIANGQLHHKMVKSTDSRELPLNDQQLAPSSSISAPSITKLIILNKPEWPFAVLGSLGAILAGMEAPLFALAITHILNVFYSGIDSRIKQEIQQVSLIFIGVAVVTVPIYLLQHYFFTLMGERLTSRVRLFMFSAILRNEIGWFDLDENSTGSLISNLAADATLVRSTLSDRLSTIVQNVALTATACVIAFTFSWRMASVVIATFPLLIGASIAEQLFLKGFGGDYNHAYSRATALARESITNIRTVAAFGAEEQISTQFACELNRPNKQALLRGHISGLGYGFSQLFAFSSYALGLWYASTLIKKQHSNFGDIMKSFIVLIVTALSVAETLALAPEIVMGSQALQSVFHIIERRTAIDPNDAMSEVVTEIKGDIEFRNVSFRYPSRPDVTVLENLYLHVSAGSSLAIVGQSGCGKSSVIALIMRFYDPTLGVILIDGCDIKGLNLRSLRMKIGLVQQEPALFSTTIYENILYGKEGASEIEVMRAAKAANAHGFISRMPSGYQTRVGERGVQLSGGQKQRVAIARVILKDPSILILDEATSALDMASEKLVQEDLDKLMEGRTSIIVAHRLSSIRNANKISVLQSGKVVETGSHEELIGKPGSIYTQLVSLQQGNNGVLM